jgi:monoamine oxidase
VGGGVAGLAAAGRLTQAGREVMLLEARPRLGGRVQTIIDPASGFPIELGAEFVQGDSAELFQLLSSAHLELEPFNERHAYLRGGLAQPFPDVIELVDRLLSSRSPGSDDVPVAQFLRRQLGQRIGSEELEAIRGYLEGFHAADLERFGLRALAENQAAEEADGESIYRLAGGYGALVEELSRRLEAGSVQVTTDCVVSKIGWREGEVRVYGHTPEGPGEWVAARVILTVPLSVLRLEPHEEGAVQIDPEPPGWKTSLSALHMGAAHRIVLQFDRAWWVESGRPVPSFIHGRDEPLPVWWTGSPPDAPFLTGWAGGLRAEALAGQSQEVVTRLAVQSLASIFGHPVSRVEQWLQRSYTHDWSRDPFSRGAYSYGGVGASAATELLRRPVADTLFLAGEAVNGQGRNATVPGALSSGLRTAAQLLGAAHE